MWPEDKEDNEDEDDGDDDDEDDAREMQKLRLINCSHRNIPTGRQGNFASSSWAPLGWTGKLKSFKLN